MFKDSIQSLRKEELDCLLCITPLREMSEQVRQAILSKYEHGYSTSQLEVLTGTTRQAIRNAEKQLLFKHKEIMKAYVK